MKRRTVIIALLAVAILAAVGAFLISNGKSKPFEFRTQKVTRGPISSVVTATGTLNALITVQVGTQVSGTISKLYVDFNSKVRKGQIIAQLDTTFLSASVQQAEANLEKAKAQFNDAKRTLTRMKSLFDKNLASQADLDASTTAYETAAATMKQAQAQLDGARINLQYATIRAPIDGVVISRNVDVGQTVAASLQAPTIFTIANDLTKMQVQASVDEADIGQVKVGMPVTFTVDAYPNEVFRGEVSQIRLAPVIVQNVVNYTVIIDVPNREMKLMPGMTANVTILTAHRDDVLRIPALALHFRPSQEMIDAGLISDTLKLAGRPGMRGDQAAQLRRPDSRSVVSAGHHDGFGVVWVLDARGKLKPVSVKTGITDGTYTEVAEGSLRVGDEVVLGAIDVAANTQRTQNNPFAPRFGGGGRR
ncbi:MAG: efflux RND transporter periplasmic adaptor subunit [Bacteroidota bacterium]